jgi:DNA replication protein DnaC
MTTTTTDITEDVIRAHCRQLHLPTVGARCMSVEQEAIRNRISHSGYLRALLDQELEDRAQRRAQRRIAEARFPALKRLSDFSFADAPTIAAPQLASLADGGYMDRAENVLLVGDSGTGKTMLATGLGVAACEQGRAVRFTTVAALVNELLEARDEHSLSRVVTRWARLDLLIADELGYVSLPPTGAELLFQILAQRSEKGSVIVTTNLPFSEWISVFTDPRLCKAVVERLTYRSHIVETGTDSYRFKASLGRAKASKVAGHARADRNRGAVPVSAAPQPSSAASVTSVATAQSGPTE